MDSTNNKVIEIMIGLVNLEIKTPTTDNQMHPEQTTRVEHHAAKFTTLDTMENVVNVSNSFMTPHLGKQPFLNDISTVFISYDDEKVETDSHNNVVRPYEHEMYYNKPKNTYKGPTTLAFDSEADDRSVDEIVASK
ncbi:hypothetical protein A2U01_0053515, partial [Trifolium medium]|nr:hypothetical protein [Trifolium medium]